MLFQVAQGNENDKPFIIECEAEGEPEPKWVVFLYFLLFFLLLSLLIISLVIIFIAFYQREYYEIKNNSFLHIYLSLKRKEMKNIDKWEVNFYKSEMEKMKILRK